MCVCGGGGVLLGKGVGGYGIINNVISVSSLPAFWLFIIYLHIILLVIILGLFYFSDCECTRNASHGDATKDLLAQPGSLTTPGETVFTTSTSDELSQAGIRRQF